MGHTVHRVWVTDSWSRSTPLLWPRIFDAGYHTGGSGNPIIRTTYPGFQLQFVVGGEGRGFYRDRPFRVGKGQAVFLDLHLPHRYEADEVRPWRVYWVRFEGPGCRAIFDTLTRSGDPVFPFASEARVRRMFGELFALLRSRPPGHDLLAWSILARLLREIFVGTSARSAMKHPPQPGLQQALNLITEHYPERITLDRLADAASMSRFHFIRRFKKYTNGITPIRYLERFRMSQALHLIHTHPEMTIKSAAQQVGFTDLSYFSHRFKAVMGASPRRLRKIMPFPHAAWRDPNPPSPRAS